MENTGTPSIEENLPQDGVIIYNRFVRNRNVLLSEVDAIPLFQRLEQHRKQFNIEVPESIDQLFKPLLAAFTLHCASRPRNEMMAWTIRYSEPQVSFFLVGDTEVGSVTGRFFDQNIKASELGEIHQELHRPGKDPHRSMVEFSGSLPESAIHQFYNVSEQRPARFFDLGNHKFALVSAHPDYDEGWFTNVDHDVLNKLSENETVNLLEKRQYYWLCGCTEAKILKILTPIMKDQPEAIFGENESTATVNCPRCSASYVVNRSDLERLANAATNDA